jgi:hypothetical protein
MAKLNISICDYCKKLSKGHLVHLLSVYKKGAKKGEKVGAEICKICYTYIVSKIGEEFDFNKSNTDSLMPSQRQLRTPVAKSMEPKCLHEKKSYDHERKVVTCRNEGCDYEERV